MLHRAHNSGIGSALRPVHPAISNYTTGRTRTSKFPPSSSTSVVILRLLPPPTRNALTFVNTAAIAYRQNSAFSPWSWHHAIVVVLTNVRTLQIVDPFPISPCQVARHSPPPSQHIRYQNSKQPSCINKPESLQDQSGMCALRFQWRIFPPWMRAFGGMLPVWGGRPLECCLKSVFCLKVGEGVWDLYADPHPRWLPLQANGLNFGWGLGRGVRVGRRNVRICKSEDGDDWESGGRFQWAFLEVAFCE